MTVNITSDDAKVWQRLIKSHQTSHSEYILALKDFQRPETNRVAILKHAIRSHHDTSTVVATVSMLSIDELTMLFPDLIYLASWIQGGAEIVRRAIISLPRAWVVAHIESIAAPLLNQTNTIEEYRRLLELYSALDEELTHRLATVALLHPEPEVREAGEDFLVR